MPTYELPPVNVIGTLPNDDDGDLTRLTIPEITYIWRGSSVEEIKIWRPSAPTWKTLPKPSVKVSVDPKLARGDFISTDKNHRVHVKTNATKWSWSYRGYKTSGTLRYSSQNEKSPTVTFHPKPQTGGRSHPLEYTVIATITMASHSVEFKQDPLSALRQQYIDLKRKRWGVSMVPSRTSFRPYYSSGSYRAIDYGHGRSPVLMYMGSVAEIICKMEIDSTRYKPRLTSGYRYPKDDKKNSLHHYGYAIDMNPDVPINTPANRSAMFRRTKEKFKSSEYDILLHGRDPHIHIEYDK